MSWRSPPEGNPLNLLGRVFLLPDELAVVCLLTPAARPRAQRALRLAAAPRCAWRSASASALPLPFIAPAAGPFLLARLNQPLPLKAVAGSDRVGGAHHQQRSAADSAACSTPRFSGVLLVGLWRCSWPFAMVCGAATRWSATFLVVGLTMISAPGTVEFALALDGDRRPGPRAAAGRAGAVDRSRLFPEPPGVTVAPAPTPPVGGCRLAGACGPRWW